MGRKERRAAERAERKEMSSRVQSARAIDGYMLRTKRERLRRQYGDPRMRRQELIEWIVSVNMKRGALDGD